MADRVEWNRKDAQVNPAKRAVVQRKSYLKATYSLTVAEWEVLLVQQGGGCAICSAPPKGTKRRFNVDHDHVTGRKRGLLCNNCNMGLGKFKDDPLLLRRAADYVEKA
jgi:hypothetical protein